MNYQKAGFVVNLLKANSNRFTPAQLDAATGSERRSRSALYWARQAGLAVEAVRDSGRAVTAYILASGDLDAIPTATPKAAKGSAKVKTPKVVTPKIAKAKADAIVAVPVKAVKVKAPKATKTVDPSRLSDESKAAVKAKNLETMKKVSASAKKHPVTKQAMTQTQEEVLEEFARMELAAQDDPREYMPAFLLKESYKE